MDFSTAFNGLADTLLESFMQGFLSTVLPFAAAILLPVLLWSLIKRALHGIYNFVNIGISKREERRAYKSIDNAVDLISNVADIVSTSKSDKK